jgi:regulator of replication initiation timing
VQEKLKEVFAWLQRDARDQFKDLDHFEEMLGPISRELPEDINASLETIFDLDIHYVAIRRALRKVSSRPAVEQKRAKAEQAVKEAQSQTESHKRDIGQSASRS